MPEGNTPSTSPEGLTEAAAAERIERLFSDEENTPADESPLESGDTQAPESDERQPRDEDEDESESSDDTDDESTDEDVADDEDDDEDVPAPKLYRVKVDGKEIEVTEDELRNGYSRTQDYTRKTQEVAEQRKQLGERLAVTDREHETLAAQLTTLQQALQAMTPPEPDWDKLRVDDPDHFAETFAAWKLHQERLGAIDAARQDAMQKVVADRQRVLNEHLATERDKLIDALPTWKDAEVAKKESSELRDYAKNLGYSDDEINAVADHRVMLLLRKAMLYDRAEAARPQLRQKVEKVRAATPGAKATQPNKALRDTRDARKRLKSTGRVEDAAVLLEKMFD